jgi:hypothetical protein
MTLANMYGQRPSWQQSMLGGVNEAPTQQQNYRTANSPTPYFDGIHNYTLGGKLPDALPQEQFGRNMAPQLSLGGIDTTMNRVQDTWNPILNNVRGGGPRQVSQAPFSHSLQQQIQTAGAGGIQRGVSAFLGGFQPWALENHGIDGGMREAADAPQQWQKLRDLAAGVGFDARPYGNDNMRLYDDMNNYTKDYYGVSGLQGWDPSMKGAGTNAAARTLYKSDPNGMLNPVSRPRYYQNVNDDKAFIGRESLAALSMALPMFGGWAGMLGQGAAGTLSAGSGLGLTTGLGSAIGTGATNALVNAGMGALTSGTGGQGFLTGLLGQGINAGLGSLTGGANNLGSLFNTANAGASTFNPMSAFRENLGRLGLGNSGVGAATRFGPQALRGLSSLFSR